MSLSVKSKNRYFPGSFFVGVLLLIFVAIGFFLWNNAPRRLETKYIQATEKCKFEDEHFRTACYKNMVKIFLSENPKAKRDFYKIFLPHIIKKSDLDSDASIYMTPLSSNCHVFMHVVGEVQAEIHFASNPENPEDLLEILSTECRLGDRVGAIMRLAKLKDFDSDYIDRLHQACLLGIKNAGEADMQQCAHALGHVYFDKYVFDTSPLHDGDYSIELGEIKEEDIERAFLECSKLSPLEKSGCFNAVAHSFYHLGHFFYHAEIAIDNDFSFLFEGCQGLKQFRETCLEALVYRIGLNEVGPYFLTQNHKRGNHICQEISESIGAKYASFCYLGIGTFLAQIIREYDNEELKTKCEFVEESHRSDCYTGLEEWTKYLKTRKIDYISNAKSPVIGKRDISGLLVAGNFIEPDGQEKPALIYIKKDSYNGFSLQNIDLEKFNFGFVGIHEARPITVHGKYKIILGTHTSENDDAKQTVFVILNNGTSGFDNLEIEFQEHVGDNRIRAVFVGDIDNDGEPEIVIGTRPYGILKYYKFIDKKWMGFDIDFLNETIHDILIADINGNGIKEVLATVSPLVEDGKPIGGDFTGRIISYELNLVKNTWQKEIVWTYNKSFSESLIGNPGLFKHPRYLFAADIDGNGSKELVANILGSQSIELLRWRGSTYSRELVEDKLAIHASAITTGDIDNDGDDEVFALTFPDYTLLMYDYRNGKWEREILAENLVTIEIEAVETPVVKYLYVMEEPRNAYGRILYAVQEQGADSAIEFYYLERDNDTWRKKYIGTPDRPLSVIWGIFSATFP